MDVASLISHTKNNIPLNNEDIAIMSGFSDTDLEWLNMFWSSTFDNSGIYLYPKMITVFLGYSTVSNFYNKVLYKKFKNPEDYKETDKQDDLVTSQSLGSNKLRKFYIMNGQAFKRLLMMLRTAKGDQVRQYYYKVEQLAITMRHYLTELLNKRQKETEDELNKEKMKNVNMKVFVDNINMCNKTEYIYIATTDSYAIQNRFKIGRASDLKKRLQTYNTGRALDDEYYYCYMFQCYDSKQLESRLTSALFKFREQKTKEMVVLNFNVLHDIVNFICKSYDKEIDKLNNIINNFAEIMEEIPSIPKKINITESKQLLIESITIDVETITEEQMEYYIKMSLENYARDELKINLDFDLDKNNEEKKLGDIKWNSFYPYLMKSLNVKKYKNLKSVKFKIKLKEICKDCIIVNKIIIQTKKLFI
jgi:phage anti-repressor protein